MIQTKGIEQSSILVVGAGAYVDEILRNLCSNGVEHITILTSAPHENSLSSKTITADPLALIDSDQHLFKSFDLIISVDQPRSFELALSNIRWPKEDTSDSLDLPFIVTRNTENSCKFRCQYRELQVDGSKVSKFVSLPMDLPPWTDEKRALVSSTIHDQFHPRENPDMQAYLAVGSAFVQLKRSMGSLPGTQDKQKLQETLQNANTKSNAKVQELVDLFCEQGLAGPEETKLILARLVALDAIKLLTGNGQPINTTDIEGVFRSCLQYQQHTHGC